VVCDRRRHFLSRRRGSHPRTQDYALLFRAIPSHLHTICHANLNHEIHWHYGAVTLLDTGKASPVSFRQTSQDGEEQCRYSDFNDLFQVLRPSTSSTHFGKQPREELEKTRSLPCKSQGKSHSQIEKPNSLQTSSNHIDKGPC
jgi:hypothetical protein